MPTSPPICLAGIVTDTIGFRTDNVTPAALRKTAALVEAGGRLPRRLRTPAHPAAAGGGALLGCRLSHLQRPGRGPLDVI